MAGTAGMARMARMMTSTEGGGRGIKAVEPTGIYISAGEIQCVEQLIWLFYWRDVALSCFRDILLLEEAEGGKKKDENKKEAL